MQQKTEVDLRQKLAASQEALAESAADHAADVESATVRARKAEAKHTAKLRQQLDAAVVRQEVGPTFVWGVGGAGKVH